MAQLYRALRNLSHSKGLMAPFRASHDSRNVLEILKGTLTYMRNQVVLEPCVTCDMEDCGVAVILSAVASGTKHFDQVKDPSM